MASAVTADLKRRRKGAEKTVPDENVRSCEKREKFPAKHDTIETKHKKNAEGKEQETDGKD